VSILPPQVAQYHEALTALYAKRTLFFVGGYPKSGTTWLQLLLNAHPEVSCIGEGHLPQHLAPLLRQALAQHNALIVEKNTTVLAELPGFPQFTDGQIDYLLASAIAQLLMTSPKATTAHALGERTPYVSLVFPTLAELFPNARFINIVRDGRDCVVSAWFHNQRLDPDQRAGCFASLDAEIEPHAYHWSAAVAECVGWCETQPTRCMLVRYEDLVAESDDVMRSLFGFLGVTTSGDIITRCRQAAAFETLSGGRAAGQEDATSLFRRGLPGDRYNHLSAADNIRYFAIAGAVLARLGYN
jgi:hypothetical protein